MRTCERLLREFTVKRIGNQRQTTSKRGIGIHLMNGWMGKCALSGTEVITRTAGMGEQLPVTRRPCLSWILRYCHASELWWVWHWERVKWCSVSIDTYSLMLRCV